MSRHLISTGSPFEKTAGYSRAVIDGDFAFVAGTTGYDYATMTMPTDVTRSGLPSEFMSAITMLAATAG